MKLKEINMELSRFDLDFEKPKANLEQYPTPVSLASSCLFEIDESFDEICGKRVADFGCGTGVFALGANLLGASEVFAFDIDQDALDQAKNNASDLEDEASVEFIRADILTIDRLLVPSAKFDTVIMNPPFGTNDKNLGHDMAFVKQGLKFVSQNEGCVYSLHKSACRSFIMKDCASSGIEAKVVAELSFPIKKMYKFHRKNNVDIEVDFIRFRNL